MSVEEFMCYSPYHTLFPNLPLHSFFISIRTKRFDCPFIIQIHRQFFSSFQSQESTDFISRLFPFPFYLLLLLSKLFNSWFALRGFLVSDLVSFIVGSCLFQSFFSRWVLLYLFSYFAFASLVTLLFNIIIMDLIWSTSEPLRTVSQW